MRLENETILCVSCENKGTKFCHKHKRTMCYFHAVLLCGNNCEYCETPTSVRQARAKIDHMILKI